MSLSCGAQSNSDIPNAVLLETLPFRAFTGGVIVVQAGVNNSDKELNFIFDTGSSGISLDSATCALLQIPVTPTDTTVSGIAGTKKVNFVFDAQFHTGNLTTDHVNFYVNDYSLLSSVYGERIDGIIGYSFLSRYIIRINYDSAVMKIYRPGKIKYDKGGTLLHPVINRLALQTVTVSDAKKVAFDFYMDTGAGLCLLMTESFIKDSSIMLSRRKPVTTQAEGLGGKKAMRLTVIKKMKLGPYKFKNVPVYLYNDEINLMSYPHTGGLLGNDLMRRFNITFNYPQQEIHIKPNNHYTDEFDYAYTGMSLYAFDDKILIDDIIPGSPAEKAGLQKGDEVISVSQNVLGNIQEYKNLLQKAKESVKMIIKRKEKIIFLSLNPMSIL